MFKKQKAHSTRNSRSDKTSWQPVSEWYNSSVGNSGHYYHQHVVIPNALKLLGLQSMAMPSPVPAVLDLGCGQGVFARQLAPEIYYQGIDVARALIDFAKKDDDNPQHHFLTGNATRPLGLQKKEFDIAVCMLALQNMKDPDGLFANAEQYLRKNGKFLIILNHPCFRIPRQSSWGVDPKNKLQYRRIDRYLSPLEIPITAHPGERNSPVTWSFHQPLSAYTELLRKHHFMIEVMEEWNSDKQSVGPAAKMENRGRSEFPLFLAILAQKI